MYIRRGQSLIRVASGALPKNAGHRLGHGKKARSEAGAFKARGRGGLKRRGSTKRILAHRGRKKGSGALRGLIREDKESMLGGGGTQVDLTESLKEMDEAAMRVVVAQTTPREGGKPALRFLEEDPPSLSCLTGVVAASGSCLEACDTVVDDDEVVSPTGAATSDLLPSLPGSQAHGTEPGGSPWERARASSQCSSDRQSRSLPGASSKEDSVCVSGRGQSGLEGSECDPNCSMVEATSLAACSLGEGDEEGVCLGSRHPLVVPSTSAGNGCCGSLAAGSPVVLVGPSAAMVTIRGWKSAARMCVGGGFSSWSTALLRQAGFVCPVGLMEPPSGPAESSRSLEEPQGERENNNGGAAAAAATSDASAGTGRRESGLGEERDSGDCQCQDKTSTAVGDPDTEAESVGGSVGHGTLGKSHKHSSNSPYGYKRVKQGHMLMLVRCTDGGGDGGGDPGTAAMEAGESSEKVCRTPCSSSDYGTPERTAVKRSRPSTPGMDAAVSYKRVGNNTLVRYAEFNGDLGKGDKRPAVGRQGACGAEDSKLETGVSKQQVLKNSARESATPDSAQRSMEWQQGSHTPPRHQKLCRRFMRFGSCPHAQSGRCRLVHDPDKVAVCPDWLRGQRGLPGCDRANCHLQHAYRPELMPVCMHFWKGVCYHDPCPYLHSRVDPKAPVCQDFVRGYCPLGASCVKKHFTPRMMEQFEQDQEKSQGGTDIWSSFLEWAQQGPGSALPEDEAEPLVLEGQSRAKTVTAGTPT